MTREDYSDLIPAGYSIEKYCAKHTVPATHRQRRAYIMAKYLKYIDGDQFPWDSPNKTLFAQLGEKHGLQFVSGADKPHDVPQQQGIQNLGSMSEDRFYSEVAHSRLLVGVGSPTISPTPYDALCSECD